MAWVWFSKIPVEFFHKLFFMRLENLVGKEIKVDETTMMTVLGKFDRVCMEIDLHKLLVPFVSVMNMFNLLSMRVFIRYFPLWPEYCPKLVRSTETVPKPKVPNATKQPIKTFVVKKTQAQVQNTQPTESSVSTKGLVKSKSHQNQTTTTLELTKGYLQHKESKIAVAGRRGWDQPAIPSQAPYHGTEMVSKIVPADAQSPQHEGLVEGCCN
ncbi:hypothetical protein M9H77_34184 [Catharanthus roseus]|uniref:Uncharacterized protein n=1 Tax=Catharanthus roseus TaxID=4058 RepID=A0ACB9ZM69_CATRO|nr:hypothetical protein M9H77_34184 [Catharanthus roseus]